MFFAKLIGDKRIESRISEASRLLIAGALAFALWLFIEIPTEYSYKVNYLSFKAIAALFFTIVFSVASWEDPLIPNYFSTPTRKYLMEHKGYTENDVFVTFWFKTNQGLFAWLSVLTALLLISSYPTWCVEIGTVSFLLGKGFREIADRSMTFSKFFKGILIGITVITIAQLITMDRIFAAWDFMNVDPGRWVVLVLCVGFCAVVLQLRRREKRKQDALQKELRNLTGQVEDSNKNLERVSRSVSLAICLYEMGHFKEALSELNKIKWERFFDNDVFDNVVTELRASDKHAKVSPFFLNLARGLRILSSADKGDQIAEGHFIRELLCELTTTSYEGREQLRRAEKHLDDLNSRGGI